MKVMTFTVILAALLALAGCGGSETIVKNQASCGQQLQDLKKALDAGAMTQSEYDKARSKAIKNCHN
jgi:hypothetical protein